MSHRARSRTRTTLRIALLTSLCLAGGARPSTARSPRSTQGGVTDITGHWKVLNRVAEVPLAPQILMFGPNGEASVRGVDYDYPRGLASRIEELAAQLEATRVQNAQRLAEIQGREEELRAQLQKMEAGRSAELTDDVARAPDGLEAQRDGSDDAATLTDEQPPQHKASSEFLSDADDAAEIRDAAPFHFTGEPPAQTATMEKGDSVQEQQVPPDLDPETATKLKLLRRLNADKSTEELLQRIAEDKSEQSSAGQKKKHKWFSRK